MRICRTADGVSVVSDYQMMLTFITTDLLLLLFISNQEEYSL